MFSAKQLVEVKSLEEIAATLDADGTLGGLPFMPEMAEFAGKRFRIDRIASKTCVEIEAGYYQIREFPENDVVTLEGVRCSGTGHDGCQRMCLLFWRTTWLRPVQANQALASTFSQVELIYKIQKEDGRYFCQSTQLRQITRPITRVQILAKCWHDVRSESRGPFEMLGLILRPLWRKMTSRIPRRRLTGPRTKTPLVRLDLMPGDDVEIRTTREISETLDGQGRNRGLSCDYGMCGMRGIQRRVIGRLDRMIAEPTHRMREVQGTVILDDLECTCLNVVGGCPRREPIYWREAWLKRSERNQN